MQSNSGGGPLISVENISKRFIVRGKGAGDLRDRFTSPFARRDPAAARPHDFWALRDVGFEVLPGQPVGIVGHNGSGKSTLLKLLTGIMKPTHGHIRTRGRMGALIEVGAGFHPDLTGRENVYLNGSILGLTRHEVSTKFDQIVDFAGLERFIDTPVKRYSSGMYMRLGFAIAAHIDPDILLIDEVLAVGDTLFQRKCLRRLKEFVAQGGAVVFVSHAMGQVAELCSTCVWLDHGQVRYVGDTEEAIDQYMAVVSERENAELQRTHPEEWQVMEAERLAAAEEARLIEEEAREEARRVAENARLAAEAEERERVEAERKRIEAERQEAERAAAILAMRLADPKRGRLVKVALRDAEGRERAELTVGEPIRVEITYHFGRPLPNPIFILNFWRVADELQMFTISNFDHRLSLRHLPQSGTVVLEIGALNFNEGQYRLEVKLAPHSERENWWAITEDEINEAALFEVVSGQYSNPGAVYVPAAWIVPSAPTSTVFDLPAAEARHVALAE